MKLDSKFSFFPLAIALTMTALSTPSVYAQQSTTASSDATTSIEYFKYGGRTYSDSRKSELGEQSEFDGAVRYQYTPDTWGHLRLEIDPYYENDFDNKSSKIELLLAHRYQTLSGQIDFDLNGNDNGGTSYGPDLDSEKTWIAWQPNSFFKLSFLPFNFGSNVGSRFYIKNLTRLNFVEGAPNTLNNTPLKKEYIRYKTIPGLELKIFPRADLAVYVGGGAASYLYPANADFSFEDNQDSPRWEWRQDIGYKAGLQYEILNVARLDVQHVSHNKSKETGSLLASASSVQVASRHGNLFVMGEYTTTKAGEEPFRLSDDGKWFADTTPFAPVYSDYFSKRQDWLGKRDYAYSFKLGHHFGDTTPYVAYEYLGKYFIFQDRESAQRLRTFDETESHGGLTIFALGSDFAFDALHVRPQIDWMHAKNKVFGDSSDVRQDRYLAHLNKSELLVTMHFVYNLDENAVY